MILMNIARGVSIFFIFAFSSLSSGSLAPSAKAQSTGTPASTTSSPADFNVRPTARSGASPVLPVKRRDAVAHTSFASAASGATSVDDRLLNGILELLRDAVITDVDAKISLEKTEVSSGRVRLSGLLIENFRIGLKLNARGTKKLVEMLATHNAQKAQPAAQGRPNQFAQILEILKLGIFNRLDISLKLKTLRVRELAVDADKLHVGGLLITAGARGHESASATTLTPGALRSLIEVLRRTSLSRVEAHAGLDKLSAQSLRVSLSGTALEGLAVGVSLRREDG
ncbi:MAG: hypothetical protein JWN98_2000 [Abditibacteriota bacterium]|nr:hypothetical protein [Abditibacteriota bacterium]